MRPAPIDAAPVVAVSTWLSGVQAVSAAWHSVKFVATGFLIGAIAVCAIATIRMSRRIDALQTALATIAADQSRLARVQNAAHAESRGLVFPALELVEPAPAASVAAANE